MATLLSRKAAILRGVDLAKWSPYFDTSRLDTVLSIVEVANVTPSPDLILEALRYEDPENIMVVILGQDPYPKPGDAQGLCFSVPSSTAVPQSLVRIFGCLDRAGLRQSHNDHNRRAIPVSGDLRLWAAQGVLMLNTALTTRTGVRRAHASEWGPFIKDFIQRFCTRHAELGHTLHFLLWGGDARAYAPMIHRSKHVTHEWSHPSPMSDNRLPVQSRFRECPHFEDVNAALVAEGRRPIVWDNQVPVIAFTDGSCSRNGKPGARASFASVIMGGQFGKPTVVRGEVRPCLYRFVDDDCPGRGVVPTQTGTVAPADVVAPTNNRGEMLGIIHALLAFLQGVALGHTEIVSDSEICVKTLLEWLPTRRQKGTAHELKNFDLVVIAERLLAEVRKHAADVVITHVRSHQPQPPKTASIRDRLFWTGNDKADMHAGNVLSGSGEVEVLAASMRVLTL